MKIIISNDERSNIDIAKYLTYQIMTILVITAVTYCSKYLNTTYFPESLIIQKIAWHGNDFMSVPLFVSVFQNLPLLHYKINEMKPFSRILLLTTVSTLLLTVISSHEYIDCQNNPVKCTFGDYDLDIYSEIAGFTLLNITNWYYLFKKKLIPFII